MTKCSARQHSDQMNCEVCGLVWDVNDPDRPPCSTKDEILNKLANDTLDRLRNMCDENTGKM